MQERYNVLNWLLKKSKILIIHVIDLKQKTKSDNEKYFKVDIEENV